MQPNPSQGNMTVAGTGPAPSLGLLTATLITAFAAQTEVAPAPKPATIDLKANRDRAYTLAIAGGCKAPNRDTITSGSNTMVGRRTFHDADEYARQAAETITNGITVFASAMFGHRDDPIWRPATVPS